MDFPFLTQIGLAILFGVILGYFLFKKSGNNNFNSSSTNNTKQSPTGILKMALQTPFKTREELNAKLLELIKAGGMIHAIKLLRENTNMGLKESKDYVEALRDGKPTSGEQLS
jgi:ribosomal protein L7/L12